MSFLIFYIDFLLFFTGVSLSRVTMTIVVVFVDCLGVIIMKISLLMKILLLRHSGTLYYVGSFPCQCFYPVLLVPFTQSRLWSTPFVSYFTTKTLHSYF